MVNNRSTPGVKSTRPELTLMVSESEKETEFANAGKEKITRIEPSAQFLMIFYSLPGRGRISRTVGNGIIPPGS
jgi:hypothetical protein